MSKRIDKMKKFLVFMLVVCSIGGMYYFSSQDAQVSGSQSQLVVRFIDKIRDKVTLQDEKLIKIQTKIYEKLKGFGSKSYIVRKMAYFSIYALIGISLLLFIYLFSAMFLCTVYSWHFVSTISSLVFTVESGLALNILNSFLIVQCSEQHCATHL